MSKVLIKSAWGSDDPTKASFAFLHARNGCNAIPNTMLFCAGGPRTKSCWPQRDCAAAASFILHNYPSRRTG